MRDSPGAVTLAGMSDIESPAGEQAGTGEPHPLDAVLAALRAVPDSVLRGLEPATLYLPELLPVGTATAAPAGGTGGGSR